MADAELLSQKVIEAMRRLAAYEDPALVAELTENPELVRELVEMHEHALAFDRMARERLGA